MPTLPLINLIGPFSKPVTKRSFVTTDITTIDPLTGKPVNPSGAWFSPSNAGIMCFPHDDTAPNGWVYGKDSALSGEVGVNALISKTRDDPITVNYTKRNQLYGNIDWRGPLKDGEVVERHRLSYWGPASRYWGKGFQYGTDPRHNEIYSQGGVLAVAPLPVLGACRSVQTYTTLVLGETVTTTTTYIYAVCKTSLGNDRVYRKDIGNDGPIRADLYTVDDYNNMKAMKSGAAPNGWEFMAEWGQITDGITDSPWFFNESGTEGRCMRRRKITHNNGYQTVTENTYEELIINIYATSGGAVSYYNNGNSASPYPYTYREDTTKTFWGTYVDAISETWDEDTIETQISVTGRTHIAVDYDGDIVMHMDCTHLSARLQDQQFYKGTHANNLGNIEGYEPGGTHTWRDGVSRTWIGFEEHITLSWVRADGSTVSLEVMRGLSGPAWEWYGRPPDPGNPFFYFYAQQRMYLRYIDMRSNTGWGREEEWNWLDKQFNGTTVETLKDKDFIWYPNIGDDPDYPDVRYYKFKINDSETNQSALDSDNKRVIAGFTRAQLESWPANFTTNISHPTYNGHYSHANDGGVVQAPDPRDFISYDGFPALDWPSVDDLIEDEPEHYESGGATDDEGRFAFSAKWVDTEGNTKYYNRILPDDLDLNGETDKSSVTLRLYPMGTQ